MANISRKFKEIGEVNSSRITPVGVPEPGIQKSFYIDFIRFIVDFTRVIMVHMVV